MNNRPSAPFPLSRVTVRQIALITVVALVFVVAAAWLLSYTPLFPVRWRQPAPVLQRAAERDAAWRQDLRYLSRELPRLHVDAFHTTDRRTFSDAVAELDAAIPTLDDDEILVRMMALVALVGDGHTRLAAEAQLLRETYPLQLVKLEDDWLVWSAVEEHADLVGTRLLHVDGTPVGALIELLTPLIAADNDAQRQADAPRLLISPPVMASLGIVADPRAPLFTFATPDGSTLTRALAPIVTSDAQHRWVTLRELFPVDPMPLSLTNREEWYWYTTLPDQAALYFQYNVCAEMADRPFAPFAQDLLATVDAQGIDRVIVDLRYNGGGNSTVLKPILDGLVARPHVTVYTLIGRNTFSSALMNAIELKERGARLVGEPTGGRPNHYGEVRRFHLPNHDLSVSYSTRYFRMLPDADPPALMPDLPVPNTYANQLAGVDAILETALTDGR